MPVMDPPEYVVERVLSKVAMGPRGCHISTYSTASHGYAQVGWNEGGVVCMTLCHRVIWMWFRGPIPEGMTVDHMCKNRRCIRLQHLRLMSNYENARRTSGRDWPVGECAHGHPNSRLKVTASGKRVCRDCSTRWQREYRQRKRAEREVPGIEEAS